jgi:hypothetical protein
VESPKKGSGQEEEVMQWKKEKSMTKAGETEPEFSSEEELMAQFSTVKSRKNTKEICKPWRKAE